MLELKKIIKNLDPASQFRAARRNGQGKHCGRVRDVDAGPALGMSLVISTLACLSVLLSHE